MLCSGLVAIYCSSTLSCLLSITQEGVWVGIFLNDTVFDFYNVPLTYLNCNRQAAAGGQSSLLGCLVRFDHAEEQCAEGREGQCRNETMYNICTIFLYMAINNVRTYSIIYGRTQHNTLAYHPAHTLTPTPWPSLTPLPLYLRIPLCYV